jgi:tyrosinase
MTVIVTGVTGGSPVARQEIRTMLQDQDLFTLYVLGLERFQGVDESDPLSWYQIAGIHGR